MNGRKLAAFALSGVMAVGLTACGGNGEPNESPAGGSGGEAYLVGICQLAPHAGRGHQGLQGGSGGGLRRGWGEV